LLDTELANGHEVFLLRRWAVKLRSIFADFQNVKHPVCRICTLRIVHGQEKQRHAIRIPLGIIVNVLGQAASEEEEVWFKIKLAPSLRIGSEDFPSGNECLRDLVPPQVDIHHVLVFIHEG